jgi:hypothetical protein
VSYFSLYFIRTSFFVLIVMHFPSFFLLKTPTETPMYPAEFEHATPANDLPQTLALDRSAIGIGRFDPWTVQPVAFRYTDSSSNTVGFAGRAWRRDANVNKDNVTRRPNVNKHGDCAY